MDAYLTRQRDGSYMLTELEPVIAPVGGTGVLDAYVRAGDGLGIRHLCARGVRSALGRDLPRLRPTRVVFSMQLKEA